MSDTPETPDDKMQKRRPVPLPTKVLGVGVATLALAAASRGLIRGSDATPVNAHVVTISPEMTKEVEPHKTRMKLAMEGMDTEQIVEYLMGEINIAASLKARGALEGQPVEPYYEFIPRVHAIREILDELGKQTPEIKQRATFYLKVRKDLFKNGMKDMREREMSKIFAASYDNPAEAQATMADSRAEIQDELETAFHLMCDFMPHVPAREIGGRGQ